MKDLLGVDIDPRTGTISFENGEVASGKKLLRSILGEMTAASFKFAQIEKKEDRQDFLERFKSMSVKAKESAAPTLAGANPQSPSQQQPQSQPPTQSQAQLTPQPQNQPQSQAPASPPQTPRKPALDTNKRTTLAPRTGTRTLQVTGVRLNSIYRECRELTVEKNENAAALLLRVFIELSSEALLTEKKVAIPPRFTPKAQNWDDIGIPLSAKISCVLDLLDPSGKAKAYQPIRVAIDLQSNSVASINTLHGYVHNRLLNPLAGDLMKAWDVWEGYLTALHAAR